MVNQPEIMTVSSMNGLLIATEAFSHSPSPGLPPSPGTARPAIGPPPRVPETPPCAAARDPENIKQHENPLYVVERIPRKWERTRPNSNKGPQFFFI